MLVCLVVATDLSVLLIKQSKNMAN